MIMNPNTELDTMMFFDNALESERTQLLTELADAVSETRTAADQAAELNEDGEAALLRLTEIWCAMNGVPAIVIFEGGQSELLANVVAQIYAHLLQHHFRDPVGLAVYVELRYMTASLMLGNGLNKKTRLRFTEEERADPALEKPIRKVDKAAAKADKAQAKIPKNRSGKRRWIRRPAK